MESKSNKISCRVDASYGGSLLWQNNVFPYVPFIQMVVVINISLDQLIGIGFKLTTSLKKELCGYLLIKNSFVNSNRLLKLKNMDWLSN